MFRYPEKALYFQHHHVRAYPPIVECDGDGDGDGDGDSDGDGDGDITATAI